MEGGPNCKSEIYNDKTWKHSAAVAPHALNGRCVIKPAGHFTRTHTLFVFSFLTPLALFKSRALYSLLHQFSLQTEPRGMPVSWTNLIPLIFNTLPNIRPGAGYFSGHFKKRSAWFISWWFASIYNINVCKCFFFAQDKKNKTESIEEPF